MSTLENADDEPDGEGPVARERLISRAMIWGAGAAWPAGLALIVVQNLRVLDWTPLVFGGVMAWVILTGCLCLALAAMRARWPRWVRQALGHTATCSWAMAAVYTGSLAVHDYGVMPMLSIDTLVYFLALAVATSIITIIGPPPLEVAAEIERASHEQARAFAELSRATMETAAEVAVEEARARLGPDDSGPHLRPALWLLRDEHGNWRPDDASGQ